LSTNRINLRNIGNDGREYITIRTSCSSTGESIFPHRELLVVLFDVMYTVLFIVHQEALIPVLLNKQLYNHESRLPH
jgi:hypothetical protein